MNDDAQSGWEAIPGRFVLGGLVVPMAAPTVAVKLRQPVEVRLPVSGMRLFAGSSVGMRHWIAWP